MRYRSSFTLHVRKGTAAQTGHPGTVYFFIFLLKLEGSASRCVLAQSVGERHLHWMAAWAAGGKWQSLGVTLGTFNPNVACHDSSANW